MSNVLSSGDVPRELMPGIVWCEKAEAEFVQMATVYMSRANRFGDESDLPAEVLEAAVREARWAVEIRLHQRFVKARVLEAVHCVSPQQKRCLVDDWKRQFGDERASRLVSMVKSEKLKNTILEKW